MQGTSNNPLVVVFEVWVWRFVHRGNDETVNETQPSSAWALVSLRCDAHLRNPELLRS